MLEWELFAKAHQAAEASNEAEEGRNKAWKRKPGCKHSDTACGGCCASRDAASADGCCGAQALRHTDRGGCDEIRDFFVSLKLLYMSITHMYKCKYIYCIVYSYLQLCALFAKVLPFTCAVVSRDARHAKRQPLISVS